MVGMSFGVRWGNSGSKVVVGQGGRVIVAFISSTVRYFIQVQVSIASEILIRK